MGAQLDQILSYLDKEGVTEVMIGMGQPASLRRRGQLIKITNTPVTRGQLNMLVQGTPLAVPADLVRLSVGIEDGADLKRDLAQALSRVWAVVEQDRTLRSTSMFAEALV